MTIHINGLLIGTGGFVNWLRLLERLLILSLIDGLLNLEAGFAVDKWATGGFDH